MALLHLQPFPSNTTLSASKCLAGDDGYKVEECCCSGASSDSYHHLENSQQALRRTQLRILRISFGQYASFTMKFLVIFAALTSLAASVSGLTVQGSRSHLDAALISKGRVGYAPEDIEYGSMAQRSLERRAALHLEQRELLERFIALQIRALKPTKPAGKPAAGGKPTKPTNGNGAAGGGGGGAGAGPAIPAGGNAARIHVWTRLDTRPTNYDNRHGADHDGLNQLMHDTGGRHVDVVIGNANGHMEVGLMFNDRAWMTKANGDGAAVSAYASPYAATPGEQFTYRGQMDGRATLNSAASRGSFPPLFEARM